MGPARYLVFTKTLKLPARGKILLCANILCLDPNSRFMKKKRILIVGYPHFARKLCQGLKKVDKRNSYFTLNTYWNRWHRMISPLYLLRADVLYSLNGTLSNSGLMNLAFKWNKRVIIHWMGTDVTKAIAKVENNDVDERYIHAEHYTVAPWLREELSTIGIDAKELSIAAQEANIEIKPFPKKFTVLTYLPENRADFYGKPALIQAAKTFPEIDFIVVGDLKPFEGAPSNVEFKGWTKHVDPFIESSVALMRFMEHDGMSYMVIDTLARGRYVLYNRNFHGVEYVQTLDELMDAIASLKKQFDAGTLPLNKETAARVQVDFSEEALMNKVKDIINLKE